MSDETIVPPSAERLEQADTLERIVTAVLAGATHTEEHLMATLRLYQPVAAPGLDDTDLEHLARQMTARLSIQVNRGVAVTAKEFTPWLAGRRRDIGWNHWLAYKQWLLNSRRPPRVVDRMDELADDILEYVGDPGVSDTDWQRRGLVIGDVQSGKTANYLGLFNKAIDAGYRLIIVLAGHTESLRRQTQARIDEGVIGRDSVRAARRSKTSTQRPPRYIGVGSLRQDLATAVGMTTVTSDFRLNSREATNQELGPDPAEPYIFVLKKNKSILEGVHEWLRDQRTGDNPLAVPLLLLDDESDFASINTREETDPTAINNCIRDILALFSHASYLGFTATPFANIFIDDTNDADLFPRDYIYSLESPSNYVGAQSIFGAEAVGETRIEYLQDAHLAFPLRHKSDLGISELPDSLLEAVRTFLLCNAIRDLCGQASEPRSMLINVSRFTKVQAQVHDLVAEELTALRNTIQMHTESFAAGTPNVELSELKGTYDRRYGELGSPPWRHVLQALPGAVADIRTRLVNSTVDRKLADEDLATTTPPRQIAVGGDVLSRGLTLDGLSVSYFYRHTKASDTLMQMARWFGYRDGYEDLCCLWIDEDIASAFAFIADSVNDLRRELHYMHDQSLTPKDFGLAVRKHPGALLVTAKNKMKAAEVRTARISLRNRRIETPKLPADPSRLAANRTAAETLISSITAAEGIVAQPQGRHTLFNEVPREHIAEFLRNFRSHPSDPLFAPQLATFVATTGAVDLQTWDVVLIGGFGRTAELGGCEFNQPKRSTSLGPNDDSVRVSGRAMRVAGREDVSQVLSREKKDAATADWRSRNPGTDPPEDHFRRWLDRPVLLLYAIEPSAGDAVSGDAAPTARLPSDMIIAVNLSLPTGTGPSGGTVQEDDVEYVINTVAQRSWFVEYSSGREDEEDVDGA